MLDIEFWIKSFAVIVSLFVLIKVIIVGRQDSVTDGVLFERYFVGMRIFLAIPWVILMMVDISNNIEGVEGFIGSFLVWLKYFIGYTIVFTALNELIEGFRSHVKR